MPRFEPPTARAPSPLRRAWPAAVAAVAAVVPFAWVLASPRPFDWADDSRMCAPLRRFIVEALREGRLPLWNPAAGTGMPLYAEGMHWVLHPVSLVSALLDPAGRLAPAAVAHVALAAVGAYVLARALGASRLASVLAGIAYALSGYVASVNASFRAGCASVPWLLAAGRYAATATAPARAAAAVALATALVALSGEFQALFVGLALAPVLALEGGGPRAALRTAGGALLGLALAGVQLVPSWVHLARTQRAAFTGSAEWELSPWRLVELVSPGFFQRFDSQSDAVFEAFAKVGDKQFPFADSVFLGAPVLLLAAFGARDRIGRLLLGCAVAALWIALGHHLGAAQVLAGVPVWRMFRYPEKLVGPFSLLAAVLAARGLDAVRDRLRDRPRDLAPEVAAWTFTALGAALWAAGRLGLLDARTPVVGVRLVSGAWWIDLGAAAMAVLLTVARRRPDLRDVALAALVAVVWTGSASAVPFAQRRGAAYDPGVIANRIPRDAQLTRVGSPYTGPGPWPEGADLFDWWTRSEARLAIPHYNLLAGVDSIDIYTGLEPRPYWSFVSQLGDRRWRIFRRFSMSHAILSWPRSPSDVNLAAMVSGGGRLVLRDPVEQVDVYEVPHRAWASFAPAARVVESAEAAVRELRRSGEDLADVLVEAPPGSALATAPGRVLAIERRPERVRIEAEADGDGFLVVNDAWWPGWTADLDGTVTPVFRVDGLVRGVRWPAGRHVLTMAYRPPELRAGLIVSVAALAALAALLLAGRRRGGRDRAVGVEAVPALE
jgi:hypothetical protein